jgi:hypothetical protein
LRRKADRPKAVEISAIRYKRGCRQVSLFFGAGGIAIWGTDIPSLAKLARCSSKGEEVEAQSARKLSPIPRDLIGFLIQSDRKNVKEFPTSQLAMLYKFQLRTCDQ